MNKKYTNTASNDQSNKAQFEDSVDCNEIEFPSIEALQELNGEPQELVLNASKDELALESLTQEVTLGIDLGDQKHRICVLNQLGVIVDQIGSADVTGSGHHPKSRIYPRSECSCLRQKLGDLYASADFGNYDLDNLGGSPGLASNFTMISALWLITRDDTFRKMPNFISAR